MTVASRARALDALAQRLGDAHEGVRHAAAGALLALGAVPEAVPEGRGAPEATVAWLSAVRRVGHGAALPAACALATHAELSVRCAALDACLALGPGAPEVAGVLRHALGGDPRHEVRALAARLLPQLLVEAPDWRPEALLSALGDPAVREDALRALTAMGWSPDSPGGVAALALARQDLDALLSVGDAALPVLAGALRDKDTDKDSVATRAFVCDVLGHLGLPGAAAALEVALVDLGSPVRAAAARALAQVPAATVTPELRAALAGLLRNDLSPLVRRCAAGTLGVLRESAALPALRGAAEADPDPSVRFAAGQSLAAIGETAMLIEALKHPDAETRRSAAVTLGELGAEEAIDPLIALLGDGTTVVRAAGFAALEAIGWVPVGVKRSPDDPRYARWMTRAEQEARSAATPGRAGGGVAGVKAAQAALLESDLASPDPLVRQAALEALGRTANPSLARLAEQALVDDAPGVRHAASEALVALGVEPATVDGRARQAIALGDIDAAAALGPLATPALLQALALDDGGVRAAAIRWLGRVIDAPDPAAVLAALERATVDGDPLVRCQALAALSAAGPHSPACALVHATRGLDDAHVAVRAAAARALVDLGPAGHAALLHGVAHASAPGREAACGVLTSLPASPEVIAALVERVRKDGEVAVRVAAAEGLSRREPTPEALEALHASLEADQDARARRAAAQALGRLGAPASREPLIQALGDSYRLVRDAALEALAAMGWTPQGGTAVAMLSLAAGDYKTLGGCGLDAVPLLQQTLSERGLDRITVERRQRAIETAERIGASARDAVVPLFQLALHDASWRVRILAAGGAQRLALGELRGTLLALASHDESEAVRCAALRALGRTGSSDQVDVLRGLAAGDPSAEVRLAAGQALAGPAMGDIAPLLVSLGSPIAEVRRQAAVELGEVGNPKAIDPLLMTLGDATQAVRHAARTALLRLGWTPVGLRSQPDAPGFDRWILREELLPAAPDTPQLAVLLGAREHADPAVRASVLEALQAWDHPPAPAPEDHDAEDSPGGASAVDAAPDSDAPNPDAAASAALEANPGDSGPDGGDPHVAQEAPPSADGLPSDAADSE